MKEGKSMNTKFFKKVSCYNFIIIVLVSVISAFLGYSTIREPSISGTNFTGKIITLDDVKNNDSPSLDMVMSHVYNIAKAPHPSGSEAILDVRNYITEQISKMGLDYEIQTFERDLLNERLQKHREQIANNPELAAFRDDYAKERGFDSFEDYYKYYLQGNTEYKNILVKVGPENSEHKFLMMAHYDSAKESPSLGAGDDGVSVASLLECMRILSLKKDMKNTVYFLITDGEELGLVGGDYFVKNPLFDPSEITLITNFEARGSKGVPFMYRSSGNNKNLLKILSKNIDKKWTFSWLPDIFKTMPNSSDLGLFIKAGYRGLDFAMGQGFKNYHQPTDSFENLSVKSANQYLKMTTEFANYFSIVDEIEPDANEDAVVFPVLNGKIMILSSFLMKIFGITGAALGLVFLIFAFIKKKYKIKDFLIYLSAVIIGSAFAVPMFFFQKKLTAMFSWLTLETSGLIFTSLISLTVISGFILLAKKLFKIEGSSLKAVTILIFVCISAVSSVMFNSASYIFSIPLLFMLISAWLDIFSKSNALNLTFRFMEILVFFILFIPSVIMLQVAIPDYIYVFYILCIIGFLPTLSEMINSKLEN